MERAVNLLYRHSEDEVEAQISEYVKPPVMSEAVGDVPPPLAPLGRAVDYIGT